MFDCIGIGEIIIDCVKDNDKLLKNPGGASLNVIATMAKYGLNCSYVGEIGDDEDGNIILETFDAYKINKDNLIINTNQNTPKAIVTILPNKDRTFEFINDKNDFLRIKNLNNRDTRMITFGPLSIIDKTTQNAAIEFIKKKSCIISFDGNYRPSLQSKTEYLEIINKVINYIDILKLSIEEAILITNKTNINDIINSFNNNIVLISDGANGCYLKYNNNIYFEKALKVDAIDTTGAGDILFGSFLYYYLNNFEILDCLNNAVKKASLSTLKYGAISSIPEK